MFFRIFFSFFFFFYSLKIFCSRLRNNAETENRQIWQRRSLGKCRGSMCFWSRPLWGSNFIGEFTPKNGSFHCILLTPTRERGNGESPKSAGTFLRKVLRFDVVLGATPIGVQILWGIYPKVKISDYFQNALKIGVIGNLDWNYHIFICSRRFTWLSWLL